MTLPIDPPLSVDLAPVPDDFCRGQRYRLHVAYDGTDYVGWQIQPNGPSIQEELEKAVHAVTGETARVIGAGRTDAGVHARGQVAHVDLATRLSASVLLRALNARLPESIALHALLPVSADFHARFGASSRTYRYRIVFRRPVLERRFVWFVPWIPDSRLLEQAVAHLRGPHHFHMLSKAGQEVSHQGCVLLDASWLQDEEGACFTIRANRFLHGMVRALVGALLDVGAGRLSPEDFHVLLDAPQARRRSPLAPPHGLVLESVSYDEQEWATVKSAPSPPSSSETPPLSVF